MMSQNPGLKHPGLKPDLGRTVDLNDALTSAGSSLYEPCL